MLKSIFKKNAVWLILLLFACIYFLISIVNHYYFRTYAFDLGINNQAIFHYAHFEWSRNTVMSPTFDNILSDHFSLFPLIFSPLYWLFKSYTMLVVQILFVLLGALGVYRIGCFKHTSKLGLQAMLLFLLCWAIFSALAFDYHDNVIAACLVPWFIHFFEKERFIKSFVVLVFILISKENMALWAAFIGLGLLLSNLKNYKKWSFAVFCSIFSVLYFVLVIKCIIPSIANEGASYKHFHYSALGNDFKDAFLNAVSKPFEYIPYLLNNPSGMPEVDYTKTRTWWFFMLSGGALLFLRPQYLLMLVPIFAQKFFNDDFIKWGTTGHYSIEFAPILAIGFISVLGRVQHFTIRNILAYSFIVMTLLVSHENMIHPFWFGKDRINLLSSAHYSGDLDRNKVLKGLEIIPENASISAEQRFVPRLAFRDEIHSFPNYVDSAEYIVVSPYDNDNYPFPSEDEVKNTLEAISQKTHHIVVDNGNIVILKRN